MKTFATIAAGAVAALSLSTVASAQVIYNNGGPNSSDGNETTAWVQAEDFNFAAGATVKGAGVYLAGYDGIGVWDGNFDYFIFSESGGNPGAVLASGSASVSPVDSGTPWCCGGNAFLFDFDFASDFNAAAGVTYFLGIHASTDFNRDELYWVTTGGNATLAGRESSGGTFNNWSNNGQEHAFYLRGDRQGAVPEPGAWALMILGFGAAGSALRQRRRVAA